MNTTRLLYAAAGHPPQPGDQAGACRVCGQAGAGLDFEGWVRDTFTDRDKLQPGSIICHACLFCFDEQSEQLRLLAGKDKPQRMRNYSHLIADGAWYPLSKADKPCMRELLLSNPQVAVIAVSGQKHLIFRAQPGWWQVEEKACQPFPEMLARLLVPVEALYSAFGKNEIETGSYAQHRIIKFGLKEWRALEAQIAPWRGSIQLELAIFLAQRQSPEGGRKETESDGPARATGQAAEHPVARRPGQLQEPLPHDDLDAVRGPGAQRGLHEQPEQVAQLALFET